MLLQQLCNGIMIGSAYALVALGLTLIYAVFKFTQLAHGEVLMAGAYFGFLATKYTNNLFLVFLVGMSGACLISILLDRIAFRFVREEMHLIPLLMSIGFVLVLQEGFRMAFYPALPEPYPDTVKSTVSWQLGSVQISLSQLIALGASVILMIILHFILSGSRLGRGLRAMSENLPIARILGVNENRMAILTFGIAGALAGAGGVCIGLIYGFISPHIGVVLGFKALSVILLAGMGNIYGAVFAAMLFGVVETLAVSYLASSWRDFFSFLVIIIIIMLKPSGLFGIPYQESR